MKLKDKRLILAVFCSCLILLSLFTTANDSPLTAGLQSRLMSSVGTILRYQFIPSGGQAGSNQPASNSSYDFDFALAPSYSEMISAFRTQGSVEYQNKTWCRVQSQTLDFYIRIDNVNLTSMGLTGTLEFGRGFAVCGVNYTGPINFHAPWKQVNGSYVEYFSDLNLTSPISVNLVNGEASGPSGTPIGDWSFLLEHQVLQPGDETVAWGIDDTLGVSLNTTQPISGEARMIVLNGSSTNQNQFGLGRFYIEPDAQYYSDKSTLLNEVEFTNLGAGEAQGVLMEIADINEGCSSNPICGMSLQNLICQPNEAYHNQTILLNACGVFESSWHSTAWSFGYTTESDILLLNGTDYGTYTLFNTLNWGNQTYVTNGFPELESVAYSRSGLLLYISFRTPGGIIQPELPTPLFRLYGISLLSLASATDVTIRLVSICNPEILCS